jgi:predicted metal-dependent enzyme (double-stranded beta helix superfamily)
LTADQLSLSPSIKKFIDRLEQNESPTVACISQWMQDLDCSEGWLQHCQREPLEGDDYARLTLKSNDSYELVVITWPPGIGSDIHDHGIAGTCGAVRVLVGQLFNHMYTIRDGIPEKGDGFVAAPGDIIDIHKDMVHQMGNRSRTEVAMSLHLYTPPILEHQSWQLEPDPEKVV